MEKNKWVLKYAIKASDSKLRVKRFKTRKEVMAYLASFASMPEKLQVRRIRRNM